MNVPKMFDDPEGLPIDGEIGVQLSGSYNFERDIQAYMQTHDTTGMTPEEIAYEMIREAVNRTGWAEDAYPGIQQRTLTALDEAYRRMKNE